MEENNEIAAEKKNPFAAEVFDFKKRPLSYSSMKHILKSPLHFADNWVFGKERKKTADLKFGSLFDDYLFFPDTIKDKYATQPKFAGTGSKKARAGWQDEHKEFIIVTAGEMAHSKLMAENFKSNPNTRWLYESTTEVQKKMEWTDKKTGLSFVIKIDAIAEFEGRRIIWDAKSAKSAEKDDYERDANKFMYTLQAYLYCMGYIRKSGIFPEFYNAVAEKAPPFAVNNFRADSAFMAVGKKQYEKSLERILYCKENDCFHMGYEFMNEKGYDVMGVPGYIKKKWLD